MRLLICAGGTGGGVYPALAVLQSLKVEGSKLNVKEPSTLNFQLSTLWVGGVGGMEEEIVKRAGVAFNAIPAAGVHGVGLLALPGNLWQVGRGVHRARKVLRQFQADVILFTGGYVAVPVALASRFPERGVERPRILVFVPDIEPGLALKILIRFANHIAVTTEESRRFFPSDKAITVTGYPTRAELKKWSRELALQSLGLSTNQPVLLISGGSRGARSINRAVLKYLPDLLAEMQVLHITGNLDWPEVESAKAELCSEHASRYHPYPYLYEELGPALAAADLVVSRAGASTLGEYPLFGLPAVLVPYPYAWRYQQVNAHYLAERGAAVVLADAELSYRLLPLVRDLMRDPNRRQTMQQAMRALAHPEAAKSIGDILIQLAVTRSQRRM